MRRRESQTHHILTQAQIARRVSLRLLGCKICSLMHFCSFSAVSLQNKQLCGRRMFFRQSGGISIRISRRSEAFRGRPPESPGQPKIQKNIDFSPKASKSNSSQPKRRKLPEKLPFWTAVPRKMSLPRTDTLPASQPQLGKLNLRRAPRAFLST